MPDNERYVALLAVLAALLLAGCASGPAPQLDHSLGRASARAATHLCRVFGYADADRRTVCTRYL